MFSLFFFPTEPLRENFNFQNFQEGESEGCVEAAQAVRAGQNGAARTGPASACGPNNAALPLLYVVSS